MKNLGDIRLLTYLNMNNPWRWKGNIENIFINSSENDFFRIYNEICLAYDINSNVNDNIFKKYFEDIFKTRVIDPEIETKLFGEGGEGVADSFFEERKKIHHQTLDDMKKIYTQWRLVGIRRGFSMSLYSDSLVEIFE